MNPTEKLIGLALSNLEQVTSARDKADILNAAAHLTKDEEQSREMAVTAQCLIEADNAQLKLSKLYALKSN